VRVMTASRAIRFMAFPGCLGGRSPFARAYRSAHTRSHQPRAAGLSGIGVRWALGCVSGAQASGVRTRPRYSAGSCLREHPSRSSARSGAQRWRFQRIAGLAAGQGARKKPGRDGPSRDRRVKGARGMDGRWHRLAASVDLASRRFSNRLRVSVSIRTKTLRSRKRPRFAAGSSIRGFPHLDSGPAW